MMEEDSGQRDAGEAAPQQCEPPPDEPVQSGTSSDVAGEPEASSVKEADSTNSPEDPVNLKTEAPHQTGEGTPPVDSNREQTAGEQQPMPQHHVRTITLTPQYRQQESSGGALHEEEHKYSDVAGSQQSSATYVDEQAGASQAQVYYQDQASYAQGDEASSHYGRDVNSETKPSVPAVKMLESAAAAAGVPTSDYMISMEDDAHGDPGSSASFLGSRLATMQVPLVCSTVQVKM